MDSRNLDNILLNIPSLVLTTNCVYYPEAVKISINSAELVTG